MTDGNKEHQSVGLSTQWEYITSPDGLTEYAVRYFEGKKQIAEPENLYAFSSWEKDSMDGESSEYQLCYQDVAITFNA